MTNDERPDALRVCHLKLTRDDRLGWTVRLDEVTPSCRAALKEVSETLGPHSRRYLAKRLTTTNPDADHLLKQLGLRREDT